MKFNLMKSMILITGFSIVVVFDRPVTGQPFQPTTVVGNLTNALDSREYPGGAYLTLLTSGSANHLVAGGTNTVFDTGAAFSNAGDADTAGSFDMGGALGHTLPTRFGVFRFEAEVFARANMGITTGSFPGPMNPPVGFTYDLDFTDRWSAMANLWYDIPISRDATFYIGGGGGIHGGNVYITDEVVEGSEKFDNSAWQIGAGVNLQTSEKITIDIGYRYVNLGTADILLFSRVFPDTSSGNYTSAITSHQLQLGIRFNRIRDIVRRDGFRKIQFGFQ